MDSFLKALLSINCNVDNLYDINPFTRLRELGLLLLLKVLLSVDCNVDNL